jgi:nucleotidyltransferase/DNA polymerase involved in DNA repair
VITGKERGIVASMSYEAKARGITRGMRLFEVKRLCPDAVLLPSDYETYGLLSRRMFTIVRRYTPAVEEYSIDECFADLTGLQRPLHMSYLQIVEKIKRDLDTELGFTFSAGLAPNKVLAKIASKWKKPSGLTTIPGRDIHLFLTGLPVNKVWGIGAKTTALLNKFGIQTAFDFARQPEFWVNKWLTKPGYEIWQELNGHYILPLITEEKFIYQTIQKVKTFTPPSSDRDFVFSQLSKNIESACIKARRYRLAAQGAAIFLKTQQFRYRWLEVRFTHATAFPHQIIRAIEPAFAQLFQPEEEYRATGVVLLKLDEDTMIQLDLFGEALKAERFSRVYKAVDHMREKYGKHTVYLGTSLLAQKFSQHLGERGDEPLRKRELFKGETKRKRMGIPMFMGKLFD